MWVGIQHRASVFPLLVGCALCVFGPGGACWADLADDVGAPVDLGPGAETEPADPLAEPFLLLLPADPQATADPEAYARWALTAEAGELRLEPFTTASGIRVLRMPDAPVADPDPSLLGQHQRQSSEPLILFLRALSDEQRDMLCRGEVVNITSAREDVGRLLREKRIGPQNQYGLSEPLVSQCPIVAAALEVVPTLRLRPDRGNVGSLCEAILYYTWDLGNITDLQLRGDGTTFWSCLTAPGARRERVPREWRVTWEHLSGTSRDFTDAVLPDLLSALDGADATVPLSDVNGTSLDRFVEDVARLTGIQLDVRADYTSCVVYAKGDEVSARALAEAVVASGRLGVMRLGDDDSLSVVVSRLPGRVASGDLDTIARDQPAPEVTEALRSLVGSAVSRPYLADLPVPLSLFLDGYDGLVSGLPEEEARWVTQVAQTCLESMAKARIPAFNQGWLNGIEPLAVRPVLAYRLTVAACVPFHEYDRGSEQFVTVDPPESYYTDLGASRDRPIYSTVTAVLRGY